MSSLLRLAKTSLRSVDIAFDERLLAKKKTSLIRRRLIHPLGPKCLSDIVSRLSIVFRVSPGNVLIPDKDDWCQRKRLR